MRLCGMAKAKFKRRKGAANLVRGLRKMEDPNAGDDADNFICANKLCSGLVLETRTTGKANPPMSLNWEEDIVGSANSMVRLSDPNLIPETQVRLQMLHIPGAFPPGGDEVVTHTASKEDDYIDIVAHTDGDGHDDNDDDDEAIITISWLDIIRLLLTWLGVPWLGLNWLENPWIRFGGEWGRFVLDSQDGTLKLTGLTITLECTVSWSDLFRTGIEADARAHDQNGSEDSSPFGPGSS